MSAGDTTFKCRKALYMHCIRLGVKKNLGTLLELFSCSATILEVVRNRLLSRLCLTWEIESGGLRIILCSSNPTGRDAQDLHRSGKRTHKSRKHRSILAKGVLN